MWHYNSTIVVLYIYYYYFYYNIQSHKGNQIQSLTWVNTKPPHKSNTSSYQLMYVGPHSKHRKSLQINSQSTLEWNVSHWDCSPGQSFPAFRLPITLCTCVQTHARQAPRSRRDRQHKQLCSRVYRFNKALGISWITRAKSMLGVLSKLEFFGRYFVIWVYKLLLLLFFFAWAFCQNEVMVQ